MELYMIGTSGVQEMGVIHFRQKPNKSISLGYTKWGLANVDGKSGLAQEHYGCKHPTLSQENKEYK